MIKKRIIKIYEQLGACSTTHARKHASLVFGAKLYAAINHECLL